MLCPVSCGPDHPDIRFCTDFGLGDQSRFGQVNRFILIRPISVFTYPAERKDWVYTVQCPELEFARAWALGSGADGSQSPVRAR